MTKRHQVELHVYGCGKAPQDSEREGRASFERDLCRIEGSNVSLNYVFYFIFLGTIFMHNCKTVVCFLLNRFHPVELTFLKEYYTTMSPVAQSINILQGEVEVQMGWLLPTISLLSSKLEKIKIALKHCKPLVEAIQVGIQNRFGEMLRDPELVAAAILIPKFKTT